MCRQYEYNTRQDNTVTDDTVEYIIRAAAPAADPGSSRNDIVGCGLRAFCTGVETLVNGKR